MQLKHKIHWSETLLYVFPHRKSHQYWINSEKLTESNGELFWNNGNPTLKFVIEYTDTLFKMRKCLLKCAQLISQKLSPYHSRECLLIGRFPPMSRKSPIWSTVPYWLRLYLPFPCMDVFQGPVVHCVMSSGNTNRP